MGVLLGSSTFIVLAVVPVALVMATMAGFAIGLLRIPGARLLLLLFVFGLTLPFEGIITPLYFLEREMGILNTRFAIVLPLIALFMPFGVFWMRAHFANLPQRHHRGSAGRRREHLDAVLADPRPTRPTGDRVAGGAHGGLELEPVPARPRPGRGPVTAHDGRRARRVPGPLRDRHTRCCAPARSSSSCPRCWSTWLFQRHIIAALLQGSVKG